MPCGTTALRGVLVAGLFCQHSKAAMQQAHTPASSPGRMLRPCQWIEMPPATLGTLGGMSLIRVSWREGA